MVSAISLEQQREEGFGKTARMDAWWAGPLATLLGLLAFLIYANYIIFFVPGHFEVRERKGDREVFFSDNNPAVAPYLAPFHAPLLYDAQSEHAWIKQPKPNYPPLAKTVYVGLAVTSRDESQISETKFRDLVIQPR